ncbi:MAG: TetR/AcrR family transcriptional regulator [Clostridium sp.]|nr:TetR/AcrR family transcriptional regulator [Clostridium sp.]
MRRKDDRLRGALLDSARKIADVEGIEAVNIRSIARSAGVATGTVYNYFANKDEILLSLTEEYWRQALHEMKKQITSGSFCGQLEEMFAFLREGIDGSAGKLMNSLGKAETAGQESMAHMQQTLELSLVRRLESDGKVRRDIWNEVFTKEEFAHFIMMNMMWLLRTGAADIRFFTAIVARAIY